MSEIRSQSRASRDQERLKRVEVKFLDADNIDKKQRKEVKKINTFGTKIFCVRLEHPERERKERGGGGRGRRAGSEGGLRKD